MNVRLINSTDARRSVVVLGAARDADRPLRRRFKDVHPAELGRRGGSRGRWPSAPRSSALTRRSVIDRSRAPGGVGAEPGAAGGARRRRAADAVPAQTINKACASGLQADRVSGAQAIARGEADIVLAGGIESMSRMPYLIDADDARWGHKMGNFPLVDAMYRDGFQCPLSDLIMGETAEVLARQYGITREESDAFALESQQKAEAAQKAGRLRREIAPVSVTERGKATRLSRPTNIRGTARRSRRCAKLPLTFPKVEGQAGIITAGSASGITDGGAASRAWPRRVRRAHGLRPLARSLGWASAGVDPRAHGHRPGAGGA